MIMNSAIFLVKKWMFRKAKMREIQKQKQRDDSNFFWIVQIICRRFLSKKLSNFWNKFFFWEKKRGFKGRLFDYFLRIYFWQKKLAFNLWINKRKFFYDLRQLKMSFKKYKKKILDSKNDGLKILLKQQILQNLVYQGEVMILFAQANKKDNAGIFK